MRRQGRQGFFITLTERPGNLVQRLKRANDLSTMVPHRDRQDVARAVAAPVINGMIKTRVPVSIAYIHSLAGLDRMSDNSGRGVKPQDLLTTQRHLRP